MSLSFEFQQEPGEQADPPALPKAGDSIDGRYLVGEELGRGGMGVVLAARDTKLDREVALKLLLPRMLGQEDAVARFENEARMLARLESPHVVRVLDFGAASAPDHCRGLPFMVLELLRGEDLFSYTARERELSVQWVVRLALEVCDGLAAAHAHGLIHRDLKPENLFIALEPDGTERVKVVDFGIARSHSRRVITQGALGLGSPGYMAPEQIEPTRPVDVRTDIWALGVVMYELLAQRPAFVGDNAQSLCLQILAAPITPLAELRPDLPQELLHVVERCMQRDPDQRFANVAELAAALAPLDDVCPRSQAERIRRRLEQGQAAPVLPPPVSTRSAPESMPRTAATPPRERTTTTTTAAAVLPARRGPRPWRRALSAALAASLLVPVVLLLPPAARAPELRPARAWTEQAATRLRSAWLELKKQADTALPQPPAARESER